MKTKSITLAPTNRLAVLPHEQEEYPLETMFEVTFRIIDITPLLQASTRGADLEGKAETTKGLRKAQEPKKRTKEEQAELSTYPTDDGLFYHPAGAFRSAMIEAMTGVTFGKAKGSKGRAPAARDVFASSLFVMREEAILMDPKTWEPLKHYVIDSRTGRNQNNGALIMIHRARWDKWATEVTFEYRPHDLDPEKIQQALNLAGILVGVGALRPRPPKIKGKRGNGGRYGKFRAELKE